MQISASEVITQEVEKTPTEDADNEIGEIALEFVNDAHAAVSNGLISASDYIDNFFVEERMDDEGSNTQVLYSYYISEDIHKNFEHDYLFKARLSLPKTQNRLRLVVESTVNPAQDDEGSQVVGSVDEERKSNFSTSLQLIFAKTKYWQVSSKTGLRFAVPPDPFSQIRIRRLFEFDQWIVRFVETLFVSQAEGFGESSNFDVEHALTKIFYFRSSSELTVTEKLEDPSFLQTLSIYQRLTEKKYLVYSTGIDAVINQSSSINRYFINARFRHNFYKKWAFYEIVPEISFARENSFDMLPIILIKLDIVFGKV